jgi:FixJ family two-component response regulator
VSAGSHGFLAVIDDDESVRESLPDLVRQAGYSAVTFSSAQEFLASASLERIDCLILDFSMPGMSGRALLREMSARGSVIPAIFITARRNDELREQLLREGAVACLYKPFSATALLQALKSVFPGAEARPKGDFT